LGKESINNIIINTIAPLLVAYGKIRDESYYIDKAVNILQDLPAERNNIIRKWEELGMPVKNAFESQGCLELFNSFCKLKKCFFVK
jgi:hypothetical protein